jgi:hypothetical protein
LSQFGPYITEYPEAHNSETDPNIGGVCREFFRLEAKAARFPLLSPSRKLFELVANWLL